MYKARIIQVTAGVTLATFLILLLWFWWVTRVLALIIIAAIYFMVKNKIEI